MTIVVLGAFAALIVFAMVRATWLPVAPLRIARRRSWGQILSASARMYVERGRLFLGIGAAVPITIAITLLQWLLSRSSTCSASSPAGCRCLRRPRVRDRRAMTLLGLGLVQATATCALVEIDAGRPVGPVQAYRIALRRIRPLLGAIALFVVAWVGLT